MFIHSTKIAVCIRLTTALKLNFGQVRFASKKSSGSSRNGRKSPGKRLGIKRQHGETVSIGYILMRQRGFKFHPGTGVVVGRDHTIVASRKGEVIVHYEVESGRRFISVNDGSLCLDLHPTRLAIRKRLLDKIDSNEYLRMNREERFILVQEKTLEIQKELAVVEAKYKIDRCITNTRRTPLIDLTLV